MNVTLLRNDFDSKVDDLRFLRSILLLPHMHNSIQVSQLQSAVRSNCLSKADIKTRILSPFLGSLNGLGFALLDQHESSPKTPLDEDTNPEHIDVLDELSKLVLHCYNGF